MSDLVWFLEKSTLNPDLPYNRLLYKRFLLYRNYTKCYNARGIMGFTIIMVFILLLGLQPRGRLRGVQANRREGARPNVIIMMRVNNRLAWQGVSYAW